MFPILVHSSYSHRNSKRIYIMWDTPFLSSRMREDKLTDRRFLQLKHAYLAGSIDASERQRTTEKFCHPV